MTNKKESLSVNLSKRYSEGKTIEALTSPYHVVKLVKSDKEVKFNVTEMMNNYEA